ncbi:MAG: Sun protein [Sandaracinaceae bacterium]|nr:MAG: Sun protein [Sandaracinaceae bacterium]
MKKSKAAPSRWVATRVLFRVLEEGAYATPALDAEIGRAHLDRRDAGLATEIVYGTLRALPAIDEVLAARLKKPDKTDPWLRAALRVGAYQIQHLSRVPVHAAVNDAVSLVRTERGPRLAGVANAVLRKIAAARPDEPSPPTRTLVPGWVERCFRDALGEARADALLGARRLPPPLGLRAVGVSPEDLLATLREALPEAEIDAAGLASRGVFARGMGDVRELPGYDAGRFAVQEIGSQHIVDLVGAEPGERIADLCCGHGTKTLALAERVGAEGRVEAADLYEEKLDKLDAERRRLSLPEVGTRAVDLTVGTGGLAAEGFHRVLLDAPCTGLGTVHRRPELAHRLEPSDPKRLAALQQKLLATAATLVRPAGLLVYAVCSPTREEGADIAAAFEAAHPDFARVSDAHTDEDGVARIGPWLDDVDAYQVVRWRRP